LAATNSTTFPILVSPARDNRDLYEALFAFVLILMVLWLPTREQFIVGPIVLLTPLVLTLWRGASFQSLGLGARAFLRSLWILPAAIGLAIVSGAVARHFGTLHALNRPEFGHVGGYVLWTIYQQFLLQDYFMPRISRALGANAGIAATAALFAIAHLPNLWLTAATLLWGGVSCWLFRRYRSLWVLGLAQGLLGLCFAVCIPDSLHHHLRVGLGYLRNHQMS